MQVNDRGLFISIEGIDGAGKTTQVERLARLMNHAGSTTMKLDDPGSNPAGLAIRKVLLDVNIPLDPEQQALLYTAARIGTANTADEALSKGTNVVCDRWMLSTVVYQSIMGEVSRENVAELHARFVDLDPDCYILLDVPPEQARARLAQEDATKDRFESRGVDWWRGLRDAYLAAAEELGVKIVNGVGTPEQVQQRVLEACKEAAVWPAELSQL